MTPAHPHLVRHADHRLPLRIFKLVFNHAGELAKFVIPVPEQPFRHQTAEAFLDPQTGPGRGYPAWAGTAN